MKRITKGLLFSVLCLPALAMAGKAEDVRKIAELSMALTGTITVDAEGGVSDYQIDKVERIDPQILALVKRNVEGWKFEPVLANGVKSPARNRMYLSVIARPGEAGDYRASVEGAAFYPLPDATEKPKMKGGFDHAGNRMTPPMYPMELARMGAQGTAYLILQLKADGSVNDVFAEKVNLRVATDAKAMEKIRKGFADASIAAARKWRFDSGMVADGNMQLRVPVDYCLDSCDAKYGKWQAYVPGPTLRAPWQTTIDALGFSPDALPVSGGAFPLGDTGGLKLLTPLQGG